MKDLSKRREDKVEALREVIKRLHQGTDPEVIKEELRGIIEEITPLQVSQVEEELIKGGMPREEIQKLCNVHLALMRESLEKVEISAPGWHPVHILMEEHKLILQLADRLKRTVEGMKQGKASASVGEGFQRELSQFIGQLEGAESHYLREENVLFPYLERHGVTEPPAVMWMEHDKIREMERRIHQLIERGQGIRFDDLKREIAEATVSLLEFLSNHFYKENRILFPTALQVIEDGEWKEAREQFDDLGYCPFTPQPADMKDKGEQPPLRHPGREGIIDLETGGFSKEELEMLLNTLPVDITFVDKEDRVRYFSQSKERIFPRTKAIIGRKVQQCHPQKSIHLVNQILDDFRAGRRDVAEFWLNLQGRMIYIRYFPVRDRRGDYLGCLEVTQDITEIRKLKGEKRLL